MVSCSFLLNNNSKFLDSLLLFFTVVVLTGAGVSAESGVPTFRGAGGFWREYVAQDLATPQAFRRDPSLVWEFYHYRREVMLEKQPNAAHLAIAEAEKRLAADGRRLVVITQNIDELHKRAGTKNLLELHGSLFRTLCTNCKAVAANFDSPICEALREKGKPEAKTGSANIPEDQLPLCNDCGGLLRPSVIWFGESLGSAVMDRAMEELDNCDLCLIVGTSSVVYPAAMFAPQVSIF
jgi:NAD-dependent deacetylase sirtuin 5